jgi:hemerythrin-like metal-binding protein
MSTATSAAATPTQFDERWVTGDERLDGDHRAVLVAINNLGGRIIAGERAASYRGLLDTLEQDIAEHFRHEHELMRRSLCPSMASHDRYHQQLLDAFTALRAGLESGKDQLRLFTEFRDQFVYHQNDGADREMVKHLRATKR